MRTIFVSLALVSIVAGACSDSSTAPNIQEDTGSDTSGDDGSDTGEAGSDTVSDSDSGGDAVGADVGADTGTADDGGDTADDAGTDGTNDGTDGDPKPDYGELCATLCDKLTECGQMGGASEQDCLDDCAAKLTNNSDWKNSFWCAIFVDCKDLPGCVNAVIPTFEPCEGLCAKGQECGLYPSMLLTSNEDSCVAICSVQAIDKPVEYGQFLECANATLAEKCTEASLLECNESINPKLCEQICDGGVGENDLPCGQLPEGFDSKATCLIQCQSWTTAQRYMGDFCLRTLNCAPGSAVCFPPPTEASPGSADACVAAWALCGGTEGFNLPKDAEFCSWAMSGLALSNPAFYFDGAAACLSELKECPADNGEIWGCFVKPYPPCEGYCQKLVNCGAPVTEISCMTQCSAGHAYSPEETDAVIACVEAKICKDLGQCFDDEEDNERPG